MSGVVIVLIVWAVCGSISYGFTLAFFQREWPSLAAEKRGDDIRFALFTAVFGPIGLVVTLQNKDWRHGFMWWPAPKGEE